MAALIIMAIVSCAHTFMTPSMCALHMLRCVNEGNISNFSLLLLYPGSASPSKLCGDFALSQSPFSVKHFAKFDRKQVSEPRQYGVSETSGLQATSPDTLHGTLGPLVTTMHTITAVSSLGTCKMNSRVMMNWRVRLSWQTCATSCQSK